MPDYTKQRKSKLIQICPECGRKGRKRQGPTDKAGLRQFFYIHKDELTTVAGLQFTDLVEYCLVVEAEPVKP